MKILTIILIFLSVATYGQKKGRAISAAKIDVGRVSIVDYDPVVDSLEVVEDGVSFKTEIKTYKIDTVYISTGDTLVIDEEGRVWKVGLPSTAPQTLSWNGGNGQITISGGNTIDIDGRYGQLGASNTWTGAQSISSSTSQLYFKDGAAFNGQIIGTSVGLLVDANTAQLTLRGDTKSIYISSSGVRADLDAGTSANVVYIQSDGELTFGAAVGGLWADGGTTTYLTATGDNVRIGSATATTYKFQVDGTSLFTNDMRITNSIPTLYLDDTDGSDDDFSITNGSSSFAIFNETDNEPAITIDGAANNKIYFGTYGTGTHTGTAAYNLEVTSAGIVIETTAGSDFRMKKNFRTLHSSLSKILALNTYAFDWIPNEQLPKKAQDAAFDIKVNQDYKARESSGVIAQEIQNIIPEAVKQYNNGYYSVDYDAIIPHLIEAIKEQQKQIDKLEDRLILLERAEKPKGKYPCSNTIMYELKQLINEK